MPRLIYCPDSFRADIAFADIAELIFEEPNQLKHLQILTIEYLYYILLYSRVSSLPKSQYYPKYCNLILLILQNNFFFLFLKRFFKFWFQEKCVTDYLKQLNIIYN